MSQTQRLQWQATLITANESRIIEMAEPLFCDVFGSERLLLVDLKIILNRNVNEFCLTEAYLKIRNVKVSPYSGTSATQLNHTP